MNKYLKLNYLAAYLEMEWSDYLAANPSDETARPTFYLEAMELLKGCLNQANKEPQRYADVGGATGRMLYEMAAAYPHLREAALIEESALFCSWSRKLLLNQQPSKVFPVSLNDDLLVYYPIAARPSKLNGHTRSKINIYNCSANDIPAPQNHYDVISCLNVVDRVENPYNFIKTLERFLAPDGVLLLSSPMNFNVEYTPDESNWLENLSQLFRPAEWNILAQEQLKYEIRFYPGYKRKYDCQVICAKRL